MKDKQALSQKSEIKSICTMTANLKMELNSTQAMKEDNLYQSELEEAKSLNAGTKLEFT